MIQKSSTKLIIVEKKHSSANCAATNSPKRIFSDFRILTDVGFTPKEAILKPKLKQPPTGGQEKYKYLVSVWQQKNMRTFKDFLRWYDNKDVTLTLDAKKMVVFTTTKDLTC